MSAAVPVVLALAVAGVVVWALLGWVSDCRREDEILDALRRRACRTNRWGRP